MRAATNDRHLVLAQWALNLALGLTAAAYVFLGAAVVDLFRFLYVGLGSALPLPTDWAFTPSVVPGLSLVILAAALACNLVFQARKAVLVVSLALLLASASALLTFLFFALVLPLVKHPQPPGFS